MNPVLGIESSMFWSCGIVVAEHPLLSSNFWILKAPMMGIQEHWVMLNEKKIDHSLSHTSNSLFFDLLNNNPIDFKKENKKVNRIEKPGSCYNFRSSSHIFVAANIYSS